MYYGHYHLLVTAYNCIEHGVDLIKGFLRCINECCFRWWCCRCYFHCRCLHFYLYRIMIIVIIAMIDIIVFVCMTMTMTAHDWAPSGPI